MGAQPAIACICLAAGKSSRMRGEHKLLKTIHGVTLAKFVSRELSSLPFAQLIAVTGFASEKVSAEFSAPFETTLNADFESGLHSSIKAGIRALRAEIEAVIICLADQPFDLASNVTRMLNASSQTDLARSISDGTPGHPVLIGRKYFAEILTHEDGDFGCAYLFKKYQHALIEQPASATMDLDTPEDWDKIRG